MVISVPGLGGGPSAPILTPARNVLNFMQFFGKIGKIVCWRPAKLAPSPKENSGSAPEYGDNKLCASSVNVEFAELNTIVVAPGSGHISNITSILTFILSKLHEVKSNYVKVFKCLQDLAARTGDTI